MKIQKCKLDKVAIKNQVKDGVMEATITVKAEAITPGEVASLTELLLSKLDVTFELWEGPEEQIKMNF